jgi:hypothetical protein
VGAARVLITLTRNASALTGTVVLTTLEPLVSDTSQRRTQLIDLLASVGVTVIVMSPAPTAVGSDAATNRLVAALVVILNVNDMEVNEEKLSLRERNFFLF